MDEETRGQCGLKTVCTIWHVMKEIYPILGEKKKCFSITRENFIQILHDGYGHWFTVSTIRARASNEVLIYDSMLHSLGGHGRKQVAALLACPEKEISINMMKVQQQEGKMSVAYLPLFLQQLWLMGYNLVTVCLSRVK